MAVDPTTVILPPELLPGDGRFGSGPSKVRPEAVAALAEAGATYLGTSHRQPGVKSVVGRIRAGLADLFSLPDGYEVLLGNGGTHRRSGTPPRSGSSSAAASTSCSASSRRSSRRSRPRRRTSTTRWSLRSEPGTHPELVADATVDAYAYPHNETSTGVMTEVRRPRRRRPRARRRHVGRGRAPRRPRRSFDVYYFAPQKCFASDGGALARAVLPRGDRAHRAHRRHRPLGAAVARPADRARELPPRPDVQHARARHAVPPRRQRRVDARAGRARVVRRPLRPLGGAPLRLGRGEHVRARRSSPSRRSAATSPPRSTSTTTSTPPPSRTALRANGIVDTEPYRKLGRNQLRIAMFPAIEPDDVATLTHAIDYLAEALR